MSDDRINAAVRDHCAAMGYQFKPWHPVPWEVDGPSPPAYAAETDWGRAWARVWQLRVRIVAELGLTA